MTLWSIHSSLLPRFLVKEPTHIPIKRHCVTSLTNIISSTLFFPDLSNKRDIKSNFIHSGTNTNLLQCKNHDMSVTQCVYPLLCLNTPHSYANGIFNVLAMNAGWGIWKVMNRCDVFQKITCLLIASVRGGWMLRSEEEMRVGKRVWTPKVQCWTGWQAYYLHIDFCLFLCA